MIFKIILTGFILRLITIPERDVTFTIYKNPPLSTANVPKDYLWENCRRAAGNRWILPPWIFDYYSFSVVIKIRLLRISIVVSWLRTACGWWLAFSYKSVTDHIILARKSFWYASAVNNFFTDDTVVQLSKGEIDLKKVRVKFSLEDMDMSEFQNGATYPQIKDYVLEHIGMI